MARDILPGHIEASFAYPTSTWAAQLGRKTQGAWHVSGYRGNRERPAYVRPEILEGPFDTRAEAETVAARIREQVRGQ